VQIIELLGKSLWDLHARKSYVFTDHVLACIAMEAIIMLQHMHDHGCASSMHACRSSAAVSPTLITVTKCVKCKPRHGATHGNLLSSWPAGMCMAMLSQRIWCWAPHLSQELPRGYTWLTWAYVSLPL
jgi:hypothetical protein